MPLIVSFVADDPDNEDHIYSNGDTITINFDRATNAIPVATKADLDMFLLFNETIADDYSGEWINGNWSLVITIDDTAASPPTIGSLSVTILDSTIQIALLSHTTTSPAATDSFAPLAGTWGTHFPAPTILSVVAVATAQYGLTNGFGKGDSVTITFSEPMKQIPVGSTGLLDKVLSLSAPLGAKYYGVWSSSTELVLRIAYAYGTATADPGIGSFTVPPRVVPGRVFEGSSRYTHWSNAESPVLTGSWGVVPATPIATTLSAVAADPSASGAGYGVGDTVTITFSEAMYPVSVATQEDVEKILRFATEGTYLALAARFSAAWVAGNTQLVLTVDVPWSLHHAPRVGTTYVSIVTSRGIALQNAAQTSHPLVGNLPVLTGSFGEVGPIITQFVADDPDNLELDDVLSVGDTLSLVFSEAVLPVDVSAKAAVDQLLSFNFPPALSYSGSWTSDNTTLILTVDEMEVLGRAPLIGSLVATIGFCDTTVSLRNTAGTSFGAQGTSPVLTGTFGSLRRAPLISVFRARDPLNNDAPYGAGDELVIVFSEREQLSRSLSSKALIDSLLAFSTPPAADYTASLQANSTQLVVSL